jgi:hypothetical protein
LRSHCPPIVAAAPSRLVANPQHRGGITNAPRPMRKAAPQYRLLRPPPSDLSLAKLYQRGEGRAAGGENENDVASDVAPDGVVPHLRAPATDIRPFRTPLARMFARSMGKHLVASRPARRRRPSPSLDGVYRLHLVRWSPSRWGSPLRQCLRRAACDFVPPLGCSRCRCSAAPISVGIQRHRPSSVPVDPLLARTHGTCSFQKNALCS